LKWPADQINRNKLFQKNKASYGELSRRKGGEKKQQERFL
jgi:hypothetical protein